MRCVNNLWVKLNLQEHSAWHCFSVAFAYVWMDIHATVVCWGSLEPVESSGDGEVPPWSVCRRPGQKDQTTLCTIHLQSAQTPEIEPSGHVATARTTARTSQGLTLWKRGKVLRNTTKNQPLPHIETHFQNAASVQQSHRKSLLK